MVGLLINYFGRLTIKKTKTMKNFINNLLQVILVFAVTWVVISISFQFYILYLHFTNQDNDIITITNKIDDIVGYVR
jgi:hypothetical protein